MKFFQIIAQMKELCADSTGNYIPTTGIGDFLLDTFMTICLFFMFYVLLTFVKLVKKWLH